MSVAQILEESKTFSIPELESLEQSLRLERLRRTRSVLSAEETRLFETINEPLPNGEELLLLRSKREDFSLTEEERARLVDLEHQRETAWARKLKAVSQLADLRGQDFESLYQQLGLALRSEK